MVHEHVYGVGEVFDTSDIVALVLLFAQGQSEVGVYGGGGLRFVCDVVGEVSVGRGCRGAHEAGLLGGAAAGAGVGGEGEDCQAPSAELLGGAPLQVLVWFLYAELGAEAWWV